RSRLARAVVAAAAALVLFAGGLAMGWNRGSGGTVAHRVRAANMINADGHPVGRTIVTADPDTLVLALPGWKRTPAEQGESYRLRLTLAGGGTRSAGPAVVRDGVWAGALPVDASLVREVAMIDERGWVVCRARLTA
ncbi:MAG: hypothetical protein JWM05_3529, partial [Acidimicrobiales bacterium]|nr:hypothetical protein [Acidimicrobiales bacterium]